MNKKLKQIINKKTISLTQFSKNFTKEQKQIIKNEVRFYDVVVSLKNTREKLGLTQTELAKKANMPRTTITKVESGNYNPTLQTLMTIASAMNKQLQISIK